MMKSRLQQLKALIVMFALLIGSGRIANASGDKREASQAGADVQLERAAVGIEALQGWYDPVTGLYKTTGWWNSGNAITVLIDYSRVSNSSQYLPVLANTYVAAQNTNRGFLNQYNDDEGWWALAWIDAYDLTGNKVYLVMAKSIFADLADEWDDTCGGGIWWSKEHKYKNAIANELFLSVAAQLANRDSANRASYLNWANLEWSWFLKSGMINARNLVNDGLKIVPGSRPLTSTCKNNGGTEWSYNQGVVVGGLAELAKLNSDPNLPLTAQKIATATITSLVDSHGILHDPCEPKCGADGSQFKGIFIRNLVALHAAYPETAYSRFIETNANAIWEQSRGTNSQFGVQWSGPFGGGDAANQSSALDAIVGAAALQAAK
jgi:predicted alpha-1,6-mannanase (GH76 family)